MEIDTMIGDTAYSEKENIHYSKENKLQLVSKLNPVITDDTPPKEKQFEFNKDADLFIYPAGHLATRKARTDKKGQEKDQVLTCFFDIEKCKVCPLRKGCYKKGTKGKSYSVRLNQLNIRTKKHF